MPCAFNQKLCSVGDREWATGIPMMPARQKPFGVDISDTVLRSARRESTARGERSAVRPLSRMVAGRNLNPTMAKSSSHYEIMRSTEPVGRAARQRRYFRREATSNELDQIRGEASNPASRIRSDAQGQGGMARHPE